MKSVIRDSGCRTPGTMALLLSGLTCLTGCSDDSQVPTTRALTSKEVATLATRVDAHLKKMGAVWK